MILNVAVAGRANRVRHARQVGIAPLMIVMAAGTGQHLTGKLTVMVDFSRMAALAAGIDPRKIGCPATAGDGRNQGNAGRVVPQVRTRHMARGAVGIPRGV